MQMIYDIVRNRLLARFGENIVAIIAYGSVTRPDDFAGNVSDVDIAVITKERVPARERLDLFSDLEFHVDAVFLTREQLIELSEEGYPLAYYIIEDGRVIYGNRSIIEELNFKVTEKTLDVLKKSSIAALGLGIESYLLGMYNDSVSHLYHAVRHAVRWRTAESKGRIPVSNVEVYNSIRELELGDKVGQTFAELVEARRSGLDSFKCRELIEKTVEALAAIHKFEETSPWARAERELVKLKSRASLVEVKPIIKEKKLVWSIKVFDAVKDGLLELEV